MLLGSEPRGAADHRGTLGGEQEGVHCSWTSARSGWGASCWPLRRLCVLGAEHFRESKSWVNKLASCQFHDPAGLVSQAQHSLFPTARSVILGFQ